MPGTKNVGTNIKELTVAKKNPSLSSEPSIAAKRPRQQIIAIAESQARQAGGGQPLPKQPEKATLPHYEKPRKWT